MMESFQKINVCAETTEASRTYKIQMQVNKYQHKSMSDRVVITSEIEDCQELDIYMDEQAAIAFFEDCLAVLKMTSKKQ